ncbi:N-acetylmuramic acid 6-phosphate etherase [Pseudoruegeria aquimaris]|nr:N-acetylmuramic acid 6-phosphate etherase [Pseudoruegeria aquimaris]
MAAQTTEKRHAASAGLDQRDPVEAAAFLYRAQAEAAAAATACAPALPPAARAMARTIRGGGTLHYVAAGSSALMALADALELEGTFGIDPAQVRIHMAGGVPQNSSMPGGTEDDAEAGAAAGALAGPADCVIALAASGRTPYTCAAAETARDRGAAVIAIANNADAPLLALASHPIHLPTPPEPVAGATRMGAGTAQKIALNTLSTLMAIELGHVHDGLMVNVQATNIKLRARAEGIVAAAAQVSPEAARAALTAAQGAVKPAILIARGANDLADAEARLAAAGGVLRRAFAQFETPDTPA